MDHAKKIEVYIREQTFIARLAAVVLKGQKVALVIGRTVYLHGATETELLESKHWLRHELMHIQQYRQHGTFLFLMKYLWESMRVGYFNNRYEVEARAVEKQVGFEKNFKVVSRRRSR